MFVRILLFISLIVSLSRALIFFDATQVNIYFYYGSWAIIALSTCLRGIRFNYYTLLFIIIAFFSIELNEIDSIYQPEMRLASFFITILAFGPLNESRDSIFFRYNLFKMLTAVIVLLTCLSFPLWFIRNMLFFHSNMLYKGLFNHSMLLGPMAGISSVACLWGAFTYTEYKKLFSYVLFAISILVLLLSGSRGAFVASFMGIFSLLFFYLFKENKKRFFQILVTSVVVIFLTTPIWYPYTENVRHKQELNMASGGTFKSRETLWNDRFNEFFNSPLIGSGFASQDNTIVKRKNNVNGGVEPGSSWLFLLSSTGLLGLLSFSLLLFLPLIKAIKYRNDKVPISYLLISMMILYSVHMIIEGYVISSGSFLFLFLWLCIGLIQPVSIQFINEYETINDLGDA